MPTSNPEIDLSLQEPGLADDLPADIREVGPEPQAFGFSFLAGVSETAQGAAGSTGEAISNAVTGIGEAIGSVEIGSFDVILGGLLEVLAGLFGNS